MQQQTTLAVDVPDIVIPFFKPRTNLKPEHLECIMALTYRGFSPKQISQLMGVSVDAVKQRIKFVDDPEGWAEERKKKDVGPLEKKIRIFCNRGENESLPFTKEELLAIREPRDYLTGEWIDITKPETYHLDHRIPVSKGGLSTLENCYFLTSQSNMAKGDNLEDEFLAFIIKVLIYRGIQFFKNLF